MSVHIVDRMFPCQVIVIRIYYLTYKKEVDKIKRKHKHYDTYYVQTH